MRENGQSEFLTPRGSVELPPESVTSDETSDVRLNSSLAEFHSLDEISHGASDALVRQASHGFSADCRPTTTYETAASDSLSE